MSSMGFPCLRTAPAQLLHYFTLSHCDPTKSVLWLPWGTVCVVVTPLYLSVFQGAIDCHHHFPGACPVSMLTEPDALPGAQVELAIRDRNGQARPKQDSLDMGRHVIRTFT